MRLLLKITLIFILLLGGSTSIFSQKMTLSGDVVSGKTYLKYSNIGILNSSFGTVSKNDGSFFLEIPNSYRDSLIVFSSVGYISDTIKIKDIALDRAIIDLKEDIVQLNEVEIKGDKYKNKIIGKKKIPFYFVSHPIEEDKPEFEYGNIFKIYNDTRLNNYRFYIVAYSKFREVTFKLSIYNVKDNVPDKIVNHTNIIYKTTTVGWQNIDLDSYNICLNGLDEIAVVLQLVDFKKEEGGNFTFGVPVTISSKNKLLYRSHSQLNWEQKEGVFLSNINVDYIKGKKEKEIKPDEDDLLSELLTTEWNKVNKYDEEKKHTAYGNDSTSGNYIELENCKIYYEVYGEGEPLILLHGNSGSIIDFYRACS